MHPNVQLTAAKIWEETPAKPTVNLLSNNSRLVLDMQIVIAQVNNLRTVSICR